MENIDFEQKVVDAAQIVDAGIKTGNYSEMSHNLSELSLDNVEPVQFVFPDNNRNFERIVRVIGIILSILSAFAVFFCGATVYMSDKYRILAIVLTIVFLLIIIADIFVIRKCSKIIQFNNRYEKYENILKYKYIEVIDDLSEFTSEDPDTIRKDLDDAVEDKLIPQGHFGTNNRIFIVSDNIYNKYLENQTEYDKYFRKTIQERSRMSERSEEMRRVMAKGEASINSIHESSKLIKDKSINEKVERMERIVRVIFHEIDLNPDKLDELSMFLEYYLPTTQNLLEAYISANNGKINKATKSEIEKSLDYINDAFENILSQFYKEQEANIMGDIASMKIIMQQDGIIE